MTDRDSGKATTPASSETPARSRAVVVGIGASAGGLAALKQFFATVPSDSGLAFVVVVHLAPGHESYLADLLQPASAIPVTQVNEETLIEPNRAYVIPPGRSLSAVDSHLRLAPLAPSGAGRAPIDHFLRTLAQTHDGSSVGVILSGTGSDGAQGIRYIREHNGLTIVQDLDEAEFDGMPRSALDTGLVDRVLPVAAMVQCIREFAQTRPELPGNDGREPAAADDDDSETGKALVTLLTLVRLRTGHDFLRYKRSTVKRRVARRMQVMNLQRMDEYIDRLRVDEHEARALIDDLLINVTSFFRDSAVFEMLETTVIPDLFDGKGRGDAVRVWSVGCATGEEAYSLGMLLLEAAERQPHVPQVQVFATDLHEGSIIKARDGFFPESIESEVAPERLDRFFRREVEGYRVAKPLRDVVVFATHNLLHDPPFSRQNLIVCRNMLIYLQRDLQDDVIELFHYALAPSGRLLLGTAETLDRSELFRVENRESHLYRRRDVARATTRMPVLAVGSPTPRARPPFPAAPPAPLPPVDASYAMAHQRLVEQYAAPSLLVGPGHEVVHFSNHVGRFLQYPSGQPTHDLFKLVRDEFRSELRTALHMVRERRAPWQSRLIVSPFEGRERFVGIRASPALEAALEGFVLVVFEEARDVATPAATDPTDKDENVRGLEGELEMTRSRIQALIEEFETTQEEMRAANEELQSANEELRSTLEELETSREELQSVNEELQTLNQENRHKVEELSQLSSDLHNLLQATDIATIFLDRNLRILRYTPRVAEIFNMRITDRGRPLADITHRLNYPNLIGDVRGVLQSLVPVEREVDSGDGHAIYRSRAAPYRTVDDRIEGAVVTFVDITALKQAEAAVRARRERQAMLVRLHDETRPMSDPLELPRAGSQLLGEHLSANRVIYAELGERVTVNAAYVHGVGALPENVVLPELDDACSRIPSRHEPFVVDDVATDSRLNEREREAYAALSVGALLAMVIDRSGKRVAALIVHCDVPRAWTDDDLALIRDVGDRVALALERMGVENKLKISEAQHRHIVEGARDYAILTTDLDGRMLTWSPGAEAVFGWSGAEAVGQFLDMTFTTEDRAERVPERERAEALATGYARDVRWHLRKDGARVFIDGMVRTLADRTTGVTTILKIGQDVTERRRMEQALTQLNDSLEQRVRERTEQLEAADRTVRERDASFRRRLGQAEEAERGRLARDLHDEAGQLLTALGLGLKAVFDAASPGSEMARRTDKLRELADRLGRELHAVAVRLRPKALDDFGLEPALESYAAEWSRLSGIELSVHVRAASPRLPELVETAIYRIVQEALTNVARHSGAKRASLIVERRDGDVVAIIEDDGRGLDPALVDDPSTGTGLGLRGIRERAALLGGTADVESANGTGTTVFVRVPVAEAA
jgi:two-component system CheB/CheR fusion protein